MKSSIRILETNDVGSSGEKVIRLLLICVTFLIILFFLQVSTIFGQWVTTFTCNNPRFC